MPLTDYIYHRAWHLCSARTPQTSPHLSLKDVVCGLSPANRDLWVAEMDLLLMITTVKTLMTKLYILTVEEKSRVEKWSPLVQWLAL